MLRAHRGLVVLALVLLLGLFFLPARFHAQSPAPDRTRAVSGQVPSIDARTAGMQRMDGLFPLYWDAKTGSLFLEIPQLDTEFFYTEGLAAGLGSNDIGLDRGQSGGAKILEFHRVGNKVLMEQQNPSFRAVSNNPAERKAIHDAFAQSVIWGFQVAAATNGRILVDATDFFLQDVYGAASHLGNGYRVDRTRSAIYLPSTTAFPQNTEVEATLTFVRDGAGGGRGGGAAGPAQGPTSIDEPPTPPGGRGGGLFSGSVASVSPSAAAVTLREHHSFVQLPDDGYTPRAFDPRSGYSDVTYQNYSVPLGTSMTTRVIRRHRLKKVDPTAKISNAVQPIVYYIDPGAPEPMRTALMEGVGWWNQAFEAAGYRNAFQVKLLPPDADPMDIRYNIVNWVARSTRGWSTGGGFTDPRTGEIIKAVVTLDSLRVRQDYLIFEGLLSPYAPGENTPTVLADAALKRIHQLGSHEVGHTLGLGHEYYDSSKGWISVMDDPHPVETLNADGTIDLSNAYATHIGDWDKVTIDNGYQDFPKGTDEKAALKKILDDAWAQDLRYQSNQDMDVNRKVDQWVSGTDVISELGREMKIRRAALSRLGANSIQDGQPMATVEDVLVPIYMYHRFAVEATASALGGQDYIYAIKGDGRTPFTPVPAADQQRALDALATTLKPSELTVPDSILKAIPPRPSGYPWHRELFPRTTGGAFDPLAPPRVAADMTVGFALELDRASRLVAQHAVDSTLPGLSDVIDSLEKATFDAQTANSYEAEVRRIEERVLVDRLSWLAADSYNDQVRATAAFKLTKLADRLKAANAGDEADQAQNALLVADITRFLARPYAPIQPRYAPDAPPGAPIGEPAMEFLAPPPACGWSPAHPDFWTWGGPGF